MSGILYGVSVGPGDPELMTLKAVRVLRASPVIVCPGAVPEETEAYRIAVQTVPEIRKKILVPAVFPMTDDSGLLRRAHRAAAEDLEKILAEGKDAAFLTIGDVTVYSTFSYVQREVEKDGYEVRLVSGVPSFCAAAAEIGIPLVAGKEPLEVVPVLDGSLKSLREGKGTAVLMKAGRRTGEIRTLMQDGQDAVYMVENGGKPDARICRRAEDLPDCAGYFTTVIIKHR